MKIGILGFADEGRDVDGNGVELAGLLARLRAVLAVQESDGELRVLDRGILRRRESVHV